LRFVNNPHPAAAQLAGNPVVRDGLPDHAWLIVNECLGNSS
jgi:hypothetical protein